MWWYVLWSDFRRYLFVRIIEFKHGGLLYKNCVDFIISWISFLWGSLFNYSSQKFSVLSLNITCRKDPEYGSPGCASGLQCFLVPGLGQVTQLTCRTLVSPFVELRLLLLVGHSHGEGWMKYWKSVAQCMVCAQCLFVEGISHWFCGDVGALLPPKIFGWR